MKEIKKDDMFIQRNPSFVRVRAERTLHFVARRVMEEYTALGGESLEELGIDPDVPLAQATTMLIRGWAHSEDGILGYLAQWGLLEGEVMVVQNIKIFVDGELVHEENR